MENPKVAILCGGKGTRLREQTEFMPNALVRVWSMPVLWHVMKIHHQEWDKERESIEIGNFCVSFKKINRLLEWHPKTSLEEGLKKTIKFYRKRKDEYF